MTWQGGHVSSCHLTTLLEPRFHRGVSLVRLVTAASSFEMGCASSHRARAVEGRAESDIPIPILGGQDEHGAGGTMNPISRRPEASRMH